MNKYLLVAYFTMEYGAPDFFGFAYTEDQQKAVNLLREAKKKNSKTKLCLMVAPSFVVDFSYFDFVPLMKGLGFDKVTELTFGAKIVNQHYHKYIKEHFSDYAMNGKRIDKNSQNKFISSVCPATVELVKNRHPELVKYLMPFVSPMSAMAKIVKKNFPKHKIVFLAPCSAKKFEAAKLLNGKKKRIVDVAITFAELKQIIAKEKPKPKSGSRKFDSFYNDYTKVYPLSGGLSSTLHCNGILHKNDVVVKDGCIELEKLFSKTPEKVFYDVLFCKGGCIGGPGIASRAPIFMKKQRVIKYRNFAKKEKMDGRQGIDKYTKGLDFSREF